MAEFVGPDTLPQVPEGPVSIYRLAEPRADERTLRTWARRIELAADERRGTFRRSAEAFAYREGSLLLELYRASGALRFVDDLRWQHDDGESNLDLSDAQVTSAAERVAKRWGLAG
jgi:hypothetical protein